MSGSISPYSASDTAMAADWIAYLDESASDTEGRVELIDKAERRGVITPGAAALLCEIYALS